MLNSIRHINFLILVIFLLFKLTKKSIAFFIVKKDDVFAGYDIAQKLVENVILPEFPSKNLWILCLDAESGSFIHK